MRALSLCLIAALCGACSDPLVMIPGGSLSGTETAAPATWTDVPETIQVETRPSDPYSINIWAAGIGEHLYIATSEDGTRWSEYLAADPSVRVRIGEMIYPLEAVPVSDREERAAVGAAYVSKYDVDLEDNWLDSGLIFRLDRPGGVP